MANHKLLVDKPYVEIGGIKWATMNIGAETETDYGLYFQWGDTAGYTSGQCGNNYVAYTKPFSWNDCALHNGTGNGNATAFTKYNGSSGDNKIVLEETDDAAVANWGGNWRMPTTEEFIALGYATTTAWTNSYNSSGVKGLVVTDKTDSSKKLFFPAAGACYSDSFGDGGYRGHYWSSSLNSLLNSVNMACDLRFNNDDAVWDFTESRSQGHSVRPVLGE